MTNLHRQSHSGILDKSDNNNDGDDRQEEDGWHYTLDATDGRITGLIKPSLIGTAILGHTKVGRRKHSNNSFWKSVLSFNYAAHNTWKVYQQAQCRQV